VPSGEKNASEVFLVERSPKKFFALARLDN